MSVSNCKDTNISDITVYENIADINSGGLDISSCSNINLDYLNL